jgi:HAE1 family hydrophobic/amphiphilic exporter-1
MRRLFLSIALLPFAIHAAGLDLAQAIREATGTGPEALVLKASADSAKSMVKEVEAIAWPKVSVYANAGLGQQPNATESMMGPVFGAFTSTMGKINHSANGPDSNLAPLAALSALANTDPFWSYGWGVQVTQPIFTFGKVSTALNMAKTQDRLTQVRLRSTRLATEQTVVDLYVAAVLAKAKLETTRRSVERQRAVVDQLQRNFQMGAGAKAQVLLAKSTLLRLTPDLQSGERDATTARRGFNRLLGRAADDSSTIDTTGLPELENLASPPREQVLKEALAVRQDLKMLQEARLLQEDYAKVLRANNLPNIAAQGKFGFSAMDQTWKAVQHAADWDNRDWSVGIGLQWNLFDGWEQSSKASEVHAAVRQMEVREGDLRRMIEIDVDNALQNRIVADSSLAAAREGVAAASEAREWFGRNFQAGSGTLSDLLQAEENQRLAELGLLSARLERTRAAAKLAAVQGHDLISLPEVP